MGNQNGEIIHDSMALFKAMPVMCAILSPELKIELLSQSLLAKIGKTETDWLTKPFNIFFQNPSSPTLKDILKHLSQAQNTFKPTVGVFTETNLLQTASQNGHPSNTDWRIEFVPVCDDKATLVHIIVYFEDVTHINKMHKESALSEELLKHAGDMETEIFQHAQIIHEQNEKLEIATKMAEEANVAKSAFLAAMSHEIRTPLNGIIGTIGLLQDSELTEQQKECANIIQISGDALLAVINNILDYSKIESGKISTEIITFSLPDLVHDCLEIVAVQLYRKHIEVGSAINPKLSEYYSGDANKIRQIITNFLVNAAKFTEKGQVFIMVQPINIKDEPAYLSFRVVDTGIGISENAVSKLFTPFTQADLSTSRKYGGTGLGLAICKRLVEHMGGAIGVTSKLGVGSEFWFRLPVQAVAPQNIPKSYVIPSEIVGKRILCVDDNEINRNILKQQLQFWKMQCTLASSAKVGRAVLETALKNNSPIDLLLVDRNMPEENGIEFIDSLRKNPAFCKLPIIILSSLGEPIDQKLMDFLKIQSKLTKPIRKAKLYKEILNALSEANNITGTKNKGLFLDVKNETKILLVEDNPINQIVTLKVLEKFGLKADVANNGIAALSAMNKNRYDLVLMDCQMPEMDGYQATAEIRKQEAVCQSARTLIIAMTANALQEDKEKCLAAGMDDYLAKPIEMETLNAMLNKWL